MKALRLTEWIRRPVVDEDGNRLGRIRDLLFVADRSRPAVTAVLVDGGRIPWSAVCSTGEDVVVVREGPMGAAAPDELYLARDVLDSQVFDLAGKRLTRVGDVVFEAEAGELVVALVEVGLGPVLRRLGLRGSSRRLGDDRIAWTGLHAAAVPGHALQLQQARDERFPPGRRYRPVLRRRRRAPS